MNVLLLTSASPLGALVHDLAAARFPEHRWRRLVLDSPQRRVAFEAERPTPDLILSFLNPYIVPAWLLEAAGGRAYNVHPSPPAYPGNDPQHWAVYDGVHVAGATLHVMAPEVDAGPICAVAEVPVDPAEGLTRVRELSASLAFGLLLDQLPRILDGTIAPNGREWTLDNKHSRADFLAMCRIPPAIEAPELERRIAAFHQPGYRNRLHVELHGRRFVYEPPAEEG